MRRPQTPILLAELHKFTLDLAERNQNKDGSIERYVILLLSEQRNRR